MLKTPVLFIIFNRPNLAQQVFNQIKKVQPKKLFISADGPRTEHPSDIDACKKTREILKQIDWDCDVKTLLHEKNLGCGLAPCRAITWFFDHVEEGIILEDDCLPSESFFPFCENLLNHYRTDTRIFHIGGISHTHYLRNTTQNGHYFIRIPMIWGWATWRRAWEKYDFKMNLFQDCKNQNFLKTVFEEEFVQNKWKNLLERIFVEVQQNEKPTFWDYQWTFAVMSQRGLCVNPTKNLISNIGFGELATHTKKLDPLFACIKTETIDFNNFQYPSSVVVNKEVESWIMKNVFGMIPDKISWKIKGAIKQRLPLVATIYQKLFKKQKSC